MGTPLRHGNVYRRAWMPAVAKVGLPGIHFHDLIYQHSSHERQRKLANAVGERARVALCKTGIASGTEVARSPGQMP